MVARQPRGTRRQRVVQLLRSADATGPRPLARKRRAAMTSPTSVDAQLLQDLVDANHILFNQGVVDAFGHVSVRHGKRADRFLMARNMAPALVQADDIQEFDFDCNVTSDDSRRVYLERFIHAEIYR